MGKIIASFLFAISVFGQDLALARLKHELAVAREQEKHNQDDGAARIAAVHGALRDWLEPHLPKDVPSFSGIAKLESSLEKALVVAGASAAAEFDWNPDDPGFDRVGFELKMIPELPRMLFMTAAVRVPCGGDQAVYGYQFDSNGRTRVIEDHPKSDSGYGDAKLELSSPDSQGTRLLLIHRTSTQCASFWMGSTYTVYRVGPSEVPALLLSSKHGFYLGNDDGPTFVLKPDELIVELLDRSVDTDHNRTHILRYSFKDGAKRIEPFAFQPQDFAEEWLTRPWSEMQSRSAQETEEWHSKLHSDFVLGHYSDVVLCVAKPDRWSIGFEISFVGGKELKEPIEVYLLVRDLGNYRFEMEAVSDSEFEGCSGEGPPSDKHPWLSVEQLKALP